MVVDEKLQDDLSTLNFGLSGKLIY
jgi:hypothetical protein